MQDCQTFTCHLSQHLAQFWNVSFLGFSIGINLVDVHLDWLNWSHFLFPNGGLIVILTDSIVWFFVTIPRCYKDIYGNSFFHRTARLWNSLPIECFSLTYDPNGFNFRINTHRLTVGSEEISCMLLSFCVSFSCNWMPWQKKFQKIVLVKGFIKIWTKKQVQQKKLKKLKSFITTAAT